MAVHSPSFLDYDAIRRGSKDYRTSYEVNGDSFIPAMNGDAISHRSTRERTERNEMAVEHARQDRIRRLQAFQRFKKKVDENFQGSMEKPRLVFEDPKYPRDPNGRIIQYWE